MGTGMLWWTLLKLRWGPARARLNAVLELGQTRNRRAVGSLIAALQRNPDIRSEIAVALGNIRDPRAADALLALLLDKQAPTRSSAVWALGEIGEASRCWSRACGAAHGDACPASKASARCSCRSQRRPSDR
jgi:hypothetical protein